MKVALRPGEALALIAHPRAWDKHVLATIHQALPEDVGDLTEDKLQELGGVLDGIPGPLARLLLYRSDDAGTAATDSLRDRLMPTGGLRTPWTDADLDFLDQLAGSVVA